jgi:hypothetical protein
MDDNSRVSRLHGAVLLLLGLTAACSSNDGGAAAAVVRDSAGITIIQAASPGWAPGSEWQVGEVTAAFDSADVVSVIGALRLMDGTVVAAEESGPRLLFFTPDGAVRSVGRNGDGPGEFRLLQAIGRGPGDTVWAYDYSHARVTRFTPAGDLVDIIALTPPMPSALALGSLDDGSLILAGQWRTNAARRVEGLVRDTVAIVRYVGGVLTDTIGTAPGREFMQYAEPGGRFVMGTAIMPRRMSATVWGASVIIGDQIGHELRTVGTDRVVRRLIRWSGPDLVLSEADVSAWVAERIAVAHPDQRESLRGLLAAAPAPARRPSYDRMLADASSHLWVAEYAVQDDEPSRWDVFDPSGAWLGPVLMPDGFRPLDIGANWVLGVRQDLSGVERIELRRLQR